MLLIQIGALHGAHAEEASQEVEKISPFRYGIGGVLGIYPGFGLGHAVQGRWLERGWMMTAGELVSGVVALHGAVTCGTVALLSSSKQSSGCDRAAVGAFSFLAFRIWETIDVWATPLHKGMVADLIFLPATAETPHSIALRLDF